MISTRTHHKISIPMRCFFLCRSLEYVHVHIYAKSLQRMCIWQASLCCGRHPCCGQCLRRVQCLRSSSFTQVILSQLPLHGAQTTDEPVPWSAHSLLEVLSKGWKSVFEDVVMDPDRRPVQAAIKHLKDSYRFLARSSGPAAASTIADALKDIALLLGAFPTPSGASVGIPSGVLPFAALCTTVGMTVVCDNLPTSA